MKLSVVISTFNRCATLLDCLDALEHQTLASSLYDVIVVDDGSTDDTEEAIFELRQRWGQRLTYIRQSNRGPGAARNRGATVASGDILLLLSDDIIATPDLLQRHVDCHLANPGVEVAVLGKIIWSPKLRITPFMRWLEDSGSTFDYVSLDRLHKEPTPQHFFTSHLSMKRAFFLRYGGFDEEFYFGYEDVELGLRLAQHDLRLLYQPAALGYHYHPTTPKKHLRRAPMIGKGAYLLERKYPGHITRPSFWRSSMMRVLWTLRPFIRLTGIEKAKIGLYVLESDRLFWQAFDQAARDDRRVTSALGLRGR